MILYLTIIILATLTTAVCNIFLNPMHLAWYYYLLIAVGTAIALILWDGLIAWVIRKMPAKYFNSERKIFCLGKREKKFFDFLGVKKWKEHLPELGGFTSFHKNHVSDPFNDEYIQRFILEACYGISLHYWSFPLSFLLIFLDFGMYTGSSNIWLTMLLPECFVNAILIVLPAFVLKYNLPKLKVIHAHNLKVKEKNSAK